MTKELLVSIIAFGLIVLLFIVGYRVLANLFEVLFNIKENIRRGVCGIKRVVKFFTVSMKEIKLLWKRSQVEYEVELIEKEECIEISSYNGWHRNNMGQWVL